MTARRAARAQPADVLLLPGGVQIDGSLLAPDDAVWQDDTTDVEGFTHAAQRVRDAACFLGRRRRHGEAVRRWAVEQGWTDVRGRADLSRLLRAGVPVPGYVLDGDQAWPIGDDQTALYLCLGADR